MEKRGCKIWRKKPAADVLKDWCSWTPLQFAWWTGNKALLVFRQNTFLLHAGAIFNINIQYSHESLNHLPVSGVELGNVNEHVQRRVEVSICNFKQTASKNRGFEGNS